MGNCQAIDAATLVVQHPGGKVDKFYWPVSASEIMRNNPGHYVALLISTTLCNSSSSSSHQTNNNNNNNNDKCPNTNTNTNTTTTTTTTTTNNNNNGSSSVRLTRIKLVRPTETLVLGQVYRLITSQDVMKGLLAKKNGKKNKNIMPESAHHEKPTRSDQQLDNKDNNNNHKVMKHEKHRPRTSSSAAAASTNSNSNSNSSSAAPSKSRIWQPSLQSISEAAS